MTFYALGRELIFPDPREAEANGLLAVGGDLSIARLLLAYRNGIYPWFNEDDPILWWSPDPRTVLYTDEIHLSRSLKKLLRKQPFVVTVNRAFSDVIQACAQVQRPGEAGTWITEKMQKAYVRLHRAGYAHSIEAWQENRLVGGFYGVGLGRCFFGESMFHRVDNASKVAFALGAQAMAEAGVQLIDCQMDTPLLQSFGARAIPREAYLQQLAHYVDEEGEWFESDHSTSIEFGG